MTTSKTAYSRLLLMVIFRYPLGSVKGRVLTTPIVPRRGAGCRGLVHFAGQSYEHTDHCGPLCGGKLAPVGLESSVLKPPLQVVRRIRGTARGFLCDNSDEGCVGVH